MIVSKIVSKIDLAKVFRIPDQGISAGGVRSNCRYKADKDLGFLMSLDSRLQINGAIQNLGNFQPEGAKRLRMDFPDSV